MQPLDPDLIDDIALGIAHARTLWQGAVAHDPDERQATRLLATDAYDVWVIAWTTGQAAELHDHGDAAGALVVVEGELTERAVEADGVRTDTIGPGVVHRLPVGLVHEVENRAEAPATSIHVYSPPLRVMTRYDQRSGTPTITELVPEESPEWAVPAESLLAHPSTRG